MVKTVFNVLYRRLLQYYGPQGWWPIRNKSKNKGFDSGGYHKGDYSYPRTFKEAFEIILGAILTQNTSWRNVCRSVSNLNKENLLSPESVLSCCKETLSQIIRSSGYYNQKAIKLREISKFLIDKNYLSITKPPTREELLSVWGIGDETADSILLYAFKKHFFVIDTYTKRILFRLGILKEDKKYQEIQKLFHKNINQDLAIYNEFHALFVRHSKEYCMKKPYCSDCFLKDMCIYGKL